MNEKSKNPSGRINILFVSPIYSSSIDSIDSHISSLFLFRDFPLIICSFSSSSSSSFLYYFDTLLCRTYIHSKYLFCCSYSRFFSLCFDDKFVSYSIFSLFFQLGKKNRNKTKNFLCFSTTSSEDL